MRPKIVSVILIIAGLAAAVAVSFSVSGLVACWRLTSLPGIPPSNCPNTNLGSAPATSGTPAASVSSTSTIGAPPIQLPPPWDGASRVTLMVVGLDYRDWLANQGAPRSDTLMLLTIDPVQKTAAMLSIPRDMWVNIPGFGYNKINAAYADGEANKLPGGGPALAMKTVESFLGIETQYYLQVDFQAFEKLIDTIGGIDVNVPSTLTVDPLGPHNTTTLQPGLQHLDGPLALAYARMRHTANDDLDRAGRQQQVILAIRDKILSGGNFANLVVQAPAIYNQLSSGIRTNLSLQDALRLAVLAKDIPVDKIRKYTIDYSMCTPGTIDINGQSQDILQPFPDKIRALVEKVFESGLMEPLASGNPIELMQQEGASVLVVNGSGINGIASKAADYLKTQGVNVVGFGNMQDYPEEYRYPPLPSRTIIFVHRGAPYAINYFISLMKYDSQSQIVVDYDPNAPADIVLAVGADLAGRIPNP